MSVHGGVVRDDRTWPRWAGAFSVLAVLAAVVAAAWAIATASQGRAGLVVVAGGFVVALAGSSWLLHQTFVAMLGGGRQPAWSVLVQVALVLVGFVALSYDPRLGTAVLAGLFGAMFAVNL